MEQYGKENKSGSVGLDALDLKMLLTTAGIVGLIILIKIVVTAVRGG